jgi:hypothetical protein
MNFLDLKIKSLLNENNNKRREVRTIVKDIVSIFKKNDEGEFYLPEDIKDEEFYDFNNIDSTLTIELTIILKIKKEYYTIYLVN